MDGISLADLPSIAMVAGVIAVFAILILWVMPRLAMTQRQELALFAGFAFLCAVGIAIDLVEGQMPPLNVIGFFLLFSYQLWRTWRSRRTA